MLIFESGEISNSVQNSSIASFTVLRKPISTTCKMASIHFRAVKREAPTQLTASTKSPPFLIPCSEWRGNSGTVAILFISNSTLGGDSKHLPKDGQNLKWNSM